MVYVYYDLHRECWSICDASTRRLLNRYPDGSKILIQTVALVNATFRVNQTGRRRVLATGHKNVHAGVCGVLADSDEARVKCTRRVRYNPFKHDFFYWASNGRPIWSADLVLLDRGKCFVE